MDEETNYAEKNRFSPARGWCAVPARVQFDRLVNDTLKLSHLPRSMFKKRGVKVSHC